MSDFVAAFDAFWASDLPEHDAFFPDLAMPLKPLDLTIAKTTDEDAWLFGDKAALAVRTIHVSEAEAPLTIDVPPPAHDDDEDATRVLLEPILGSPVDVLDAMAAFMVDEVDPFQEVVVSSDDEPMSPMTTPYRTDAQKLAKLRSTVTHLEKMYYARCHGRTANDVDIPRVKMVRSIERLQRIAVDVARENYGFRQHKMPQRAREELLLHELGGVLKGPLMREQLRNAIPDKLCVDAIAATVREAATAAMGLEAVAGETLLGWDCRKTIDASGLAFATKKAFSDDYARVTSSAWELLVATEQFATFMKHGAGRTTRSHVLQRLSSDAISIAFDTVVATNDSVAIERDVCVAFRTRVPSGILVGITSIAPSVYARDMHAVDGVSYVEKGMRWMEFAPTNNSGFAVTAGGHVHCASPAVAERVHVASLASVLQWERAHVATPSLL